MKKEKTLLFSISVKTGELILETFSGSGAGGQNRNKKKKCVRLKHPESGVTVIATEQRSLEQNKKLAHKRMLKHPDFILWNRMKAASDYQGVSIFDPNNMTGKYKEPFREEDLKIETKINGKWVEVGK